MNLRLLTIIFLIALFIECAAIAFGIQSIQLIAKPSLVLILLAYFWTNSRNLASTKYLVAAALFFSWLGDVFLLVEKQNPRFFIFGLLAFLVAHLFYIAYFGRITRANSVKRHLKPVPFAIIAVYVITLFALLSPKLGNLQIPVAIYTLALSTMLLASIHAFDFAKHDFAKLCVAGTALFVASDSMLAINRFYQTFAFAGVLIMLTYGIAQLCITVGALKNLEFLEAKD